ncbi:hypothetical protein [Idiomarina abyssalis]|uniref:Uncharacterized protein n=1 Tax=Idiomarina abyssalis TaxID=86102 RepID=A0A8I1KIG9_9GAMM|nr:hypothetical protein [Idiomarina abyssalis]MBJ7265421.1 hypothetical protein [Idiomarina abyssalis]MBJ7316905.1 hypothetical protein [Idiomarina abyssalis]
MSNEAACIRFPSGNVYFTGYHGCSSAIHNIIFKDKAQLFIDAFTDPEEDAFLETAESYEDREAFEKQRSERKYDDLVDVEIFTPYAGGILWKAKASEGAKVVVSGLSDMDSNATTSYRKCSEWPEWVKETGMPETRSLLVESWISK